MTDRVIAGRVWVVTYNSPRKFYNGIRWYRFGVRLRGWHNLGGLWFSRTRPFFRYLTPDGPRSPAGAVK